MSATKELVNIDYAQFFIWFMMILFGIVAIIEVVGKISVYIDKPVRWVRKKNEDHDALIGAIKKVERIEQRQDEIEKESKENDVAIKEDIAELKQLFIDKDINDMRLAVLDFASAISNGRKYTREQYSEVLGTYDRYEALLKKYGRTNGKAELSIQIIRNSYIEHMENNDFK